MSPANTAKLKEQFDAGLETRADFTIDQPRHRYGAVDHAVWKQLYTRQTALLEGRVCDEFLAGVEKLNLSAERVPSFAAINAQLTPATGWRIGAGAWARAGPRVFRASGEPPLSGDLVDTPSRPARLSAGTGLLPRSVRPRAAADQPGLRRLHAHHYMHTTTCTPMAARRSPPATPARCRCSRASTGTRSNSGQSTMRRARTA